VARLTSCWGALAVLLVSFGGQAHGKAPTVGTVRLNDGDTLSVVRFGTVSAPTEYFLLSTPEVPLSGLKRLRQEVLKDGSSVWTGVRPDGTEVHGSGVARHELQSGKVISVPLQYSLSPDGRGRGLSFVYSSVDGRLTPTTVGAAELVEVILDTAAKPPEGPISVDLDLLSSLRGYVRWIGGKNIQSRADVIARASALGVPVKTAAMEVKDISQYATMLDLLMSTGHCATKEQVLEGTARFKDWLDCEERKQENALSKRPGQLLTNGDLPLLLIRYYAILQSDLERGKRDPIVIPVESADAPPVASTPPSKEDPPLSAQQQALAKRLTVIGANAFFSLTSVQELLVKKLRTDTLQQFADGPNAFWFLTEHSALKNGHDYCSAMVGLTEVPPKGRAARLPDTYSSAMRQVTRARADADLNEESVRSCQAGALRQAIESFAEWTTTKQLDGIARTRGRGTVAPAPSGSPRGLSHFFRVGVTADASREVANLVPDDFSDAFDYRRGSWFLLAESFHFDDQVVCFALAGLTAHPPEDRNARFPPNYYVDVREMNAEESRPEGSEHRCQDQGAIQVVKFALDQAWDEENLLSRFAETREDGVPLVAGFRKKKVAQTPAATGGPGPAARRGLADALRAPGQCQPPAGRVLHYRDQCSNGDCRRTFENGCSVRFQAPYCYDALSGDWTWKPDGC
jgi:hypothetical protein